MKLCLVGLFMCLFVQTSFAQQNQVKLQDGKIIVQTPEETKILDYSAAEKYSVVELKRLNVRKESEVVEEALQVYKEKQAPVYSQKIWISQKDDGSQSILIEYKSLKEDSRVIFSPDEEFLYYIGLSALGENVVYGFNISAKEDLVFGAADDFQLKECPGSSDYFVLLKDNEDPRIIVYDAQGSKEDILYYTGDLTDINELICN